MKLIKKTSQYRRDFEGILECESCKKQETLKYGYDDANYHNNVIPNMKCKSCNKSSKDLGITNTTTPDVPAHIVM